MVATASWQRVRFELAEEYKVCTEACDADTERVRFIPNAVVFQRSIVLVLVVFLFSGFDVVISFWDAVLLLISSLVSLASLVLRPSPENMR